MVHREPPIAALPALLPGSLAADMVDRADGARCRRVTSWLRAGRWVLQASFAVGLIAVGIVSLLPGPQMPPLGDHDKLMHALAYGVLAANGGLAFGDHGRWLRLGLALFAFGLALEAVQGVLPGREVSLADVLANGIGVVIGFGVAGMAVALGRLALRRAGRLPAGQREREGRAVATAPAAATGLSDT